MILKAHYLGCLSHASYVVGDETTRKAAVVDPQRDVGVYLEEAARLGLTITDVLLTHFHADFVSGHLELQSATGAAIHVGARGKTDYRSVPARDGDLVDLGPSVKIRVLETPGHTPESVCYVVLDRAKGDAPVCVFTGDTLFIGDVGRPDLMASVGIEAADLAGMLYDSLREKILPLPDATVVYPAHGAGSLCGKNLSRETSSPLGTQRRTNYALSPMPKAEFVRLVTADQPECPSYFAFDADLNRREHATLTETLDRALVALSLDDVLRLDAEGATLLDTRGPAEFGAAHLRGSVNVGLAGTYATWAGTLLDRTKPVVILADPGKEGEAAMRLGRIGIDRVVGFLPDVHGVLVKRPDLVRRTRKMSAVDLVRRIDAGDPPLILDVRTPGEWNAGHVPGSLNIPLLKLAQRMGEVPRGEEIVVQCQSGYRSSMAVSVLERAGFDQLSDLVGGWGAFQAARAPAFPEA